MPGVCPVCAREGARAQQLRLTVRSSSAAILGAVQTEGSPAGPEEQPQALLCPRRVPLGGNHHGCLGDALGGAWRGGGASGLRMG